MRKPLRSKRKFFKPIPVIGTLATLVFALWFAFGPSGMWNSHQLSQKRKEQAEKIRLLQAQRQQLQTYLMELRAQDELAMQRAARERGLVAPNEIIYEVKVENKN